MNEAKRFQNMNCPTCSMAWGLNPPAKCDGGNYYRCIDCKAVYSSEMLAAHDMLDALKQCHAVYGEMPAGGTRETLYQAYSAAEDAIEKATA